MALELLSDHLEQHQEALIDAQTNRKAKEREVRAGLAQKQRAFDSAAEQWMPWLKDEDDPRSVNVSKLAAKYRPWMEAVPFAKPALAYIVAQIHAQSTKRTTGATNGKPKGMMPPGGGASPQARRPIKREERLAQSAKRHLEDPSDQNLEDYLANLVE
jgi:hypothetical protein